MNRINIFSAEVEIIQEIKQAQICLLNKQDYLANELFDEATYEGVPLTVEQAIAYAKGDGLEPEIFAKFGEGLQGRILRWDNELAECISNLRNAEEKLSKHKANKPEYDYTASDSDLSELYDLTAFAYDCGRKEWERQLQTAWQDYCEAPPSGGRKYKTYSDYVRAQIGALREDLPRL